MVTASTKSHEEPTIRLAKHLDQSGVLGLPDKVEALQKALDQEQAEKAQLKAELELLKAEFNESKGGVATVLKSLDAIAVLVKGQPPAQAPTTTLNLSADGLAADIGKVLTKGIEEVISRTAERPIAAPQFHVPTGDLGEILGKAMAGSFLVGVTPILKALAERPVSEVHHVREAAPAIPPPSIVEHVHHDAPQVNVDTSAFAQIVEGLTKAVRKSIEAMQEQTQAVLKALHESNEIVRKTLAERDKPLPPTKPIKKVMRQKYNGEWEITSEQDQDNEHASTD